MESLRKRKRSKRALYVFGNQSKRALKWIKRRKVNDDFDINNGDASKDTNIIDDLPETLLLVEIFSKLSNPRDLIVCKSVSKRWNSLLSSSSFHYTRSLALALNNTRKPQLATNDVCLESWKGFELSNYIDLDLDQYPLCVLASYKDVLLCMKRSSPRVKRRQRSKYYIVNPVTMQWNR